MERFDDESALSRLAQARCKWPILHSAPYLKGSYAEFGRV
jgi:hypothetical protein